ncbi:hypothetical protein H9I48_00945 [Wolbachia pipientis]|nr:hypothetical protein [Wolbachia pipientis]
MFVAKRQPSSRYLLADEIPRMNRGMTVCCLLAAKRYRGGMTVKWGVIPVRDTGI